VFHSQPLEDEKSGRIHLDPRRRGGTNSDAWRRNDSLSAPTVPGRGRREDGAWVGGLEQDLFITKTDDSSTWVIKVILGGNSPKRYN